MAYDLVYAATAVRQLRKLDRPTARRIVDYLEEVAGLDDARTRGKGLVGDHAGIWRFRIGDYRALCEIRDSELTILALDIGHRDGIYG